MKLRRTLSLATCALGTLLAVSPVAHASHWTAVASTGTVDESAAAAGIFAFGPTTLGYLPGIMALAPIVARYNVTNTSGVDIAPWTTLELGYFDNAAAGQITADLYKVDPCTGVRSLLCTATSANMAVPSCVTCTFAGNVIDFSQYLYYVEVTVDRNNAGALPTANTLRIF